MLQNKMDDMNVSAVMLQKQSTHPWGEDIWSLIGLIPGVSQKDLGELELQGKLHIWSNLTIELHTLHCESYYHNLISGKPQIYIVCNSNAAVLSPLLITVDYDEAASYLESDEVVVQTELSAELIPWVEKFVLDNYTPEKRKKRRRKKWHDDGEST